MHSRSNPEGSLHGMKVSAVQRPQRKLHGRIILNEAWIALIYEKIIFYRLAPYPKKEMSFKLPLQFGQGSW